MRNLEDSYLEFFIITKNKNEGKERKKISRELWHGHEELKNIGGMRYYSLMKNGPRDEREVSK